MSIMTSLSIIVRFSGPLHLLIQFLEHLLALDQHLKPHLLLGVSQDAVQTLHLLQLGLLLSVRAMFQFSDHSIQEWDIMLH